MVVLCRGFLFFCQRLSETGHMVHFGGNGWWLIWSTRRIYSFILNNDLKQKLQLIIHPNKSFLPRWCWITWICTSVDSLFASFMLGLLFCFSWLSSSAPTDMTYTLKPFSIFLWTHTFLERISVDEIQFLIFSIKLAQFPCGHGRSSPFFCLWWFSVSDSVEVLFKMCSIVRCGFCFSVALDFVLLDFSHFSV